MKIIPKFAPVDPRDDAVLDSAFAAVEAQPIACCNWPESYPNAPKVSFRMFHTGALLLLRFDVEEQCTAARVAEDNGRVWTDSCVEFFLAPGDEEGYYNFETTCIGRMLLGYRRTHADAVHAPAAIMERIARTPTLGSEPFAERTGDNRWRVTLAIPPEALFRHTIADWSGLEARMNLYKCGDELSQPHFLSWQPIATPRPNFHVPEFFARMKFEA